MFNGPGKYDELCTIARIGARAKGAILFIIDGDKGDGFEVQAPLDVLLDLPRSLRQMADSIQAQQRATAVSCPKCGAMSYHPIDAERGYCGACHKFTVP